MEVSSSTFSSYAVGRLFNTIQQIESTDSLEYSESLSLFALILAKQNEPIDRILSIADRNEIRRTETYAKVASCLRQTGRFEDLEEINRRDTRRTSCIMTYALAKAALAQHDPARARELAMELGNIPYRGRILRKIAVWEARYSTQKAYATIDKIGEGSLARFRAKLDVAKLSASRNRENIPAIFEKLEGDVEELLPCIRFWARQKILCAITELDPELGWKQVQRFSDQSPDDALTSFETHSTASRSVELVEKLLPRHPPIWRYRAFLKIGRKTAKENPELAKRCFQKAGETGCADWPVFHLFELVMIKSMRLWASLDPYSAYREVLRIDCPDFRGEMLELFLSSAPPKWKEKAVNRIAEGRVKDLGRLMLEVEEDPFSSEAVEAILRKYPPQEQVTLLVKLLQTRLV